MSQTRFGADDEEKKVLLSVGTQTLEKKCVLLFLGNGISILKDKNSDGT